jgi:hypothetical protein
MRTFFDHKGFFCFNRHLGSTLNYLRFFYSKKAMHYEYVMERDPSFVNFGFFNVLDAFFIKIKHIFLVLFVT